ESSNGDLRERELAEEEFDQFFMISLDPLCIAGFDGYFKRLNPAWERTLGYTTNELLTEPFLSFVHPDDRERTAAEAAKLAGGRDTIRFENRYRCKDGSYRWMLWTATPHRDRELIFAAARDMTESKQAEDDLRRQQQQLEAVFAATPDMITVISPEGQIVSRSAAMLNVLGYEPGQLLNTAALEIVHPDDRQLVAEFLQALTRGDARDIRYRARHADGRWVTMDAKAL